MQAFHCDGLWWLPENSSEKVAGTLHFSEENGIDLVLGGVLGEPASALEKKAVPIVHGLVWGCSLGHVVTLKDCQAKGFHLGTAGIAREDYFADRLFFGAHFPKKEDFSFSELSLSLSGLPSWADILSGFSYRHIPTGEGHLDGFEIRWLRPEPIRGAISGGDFVLGLGYEQFGSLRDWTIKENVGIVISCQSPQPDDVLYTRYVYPLQNLLTLATDHPNAVVEFRVRQPNSKNEILILSSQMFHDTAIATDLLSHKMLFTLADVKDRVVDLIRRWIELSDRLKDVCNLYFANQDKPETYLDVKFFLVFQALEVYQRQRQTAARDIVNSSGPLLGALFTSLLQEHKAVVGPLVGDDAAKAAEQVLRYRNYIVHHDSDLGNGPNYNADLFWLTQKLLCLMKACLLTELGIPVEDQLKFFRRNQMYVHILAQASP
jgi:hypothetical protein